MPDVQPAEAKLFRREALEQYQRGSAVEGHLLELEPAWTRYAYRLIVLLSAAALLLAALTHIDREAEGGAVIRDGRLVAVFPARYGPELRPRMPLRCALIPQAMSVHSVNRTIISASEARRLLGPDGAALWRSANPAVTVDAALPAGASFGDGVAAPVRVRLTRERVLFVLIPVLRRLHA
jgi:hypothetical protein